LYEALTGKLAFTGDTVPDTLTAVLGKEPDWDALPKETPSRLRQLLARTLRKDARVRLQHVGDARIEFLDLSAEPSVDVPASSKPRYAVTLVAALTVRADGGIPEPLLEREHGQFPTSVSRDGRLVAFREGHPDNRGDIHILPLDGSTDPYPFLATPAENKAKKSLTALAAQVGSR
jgi:hypothetical protein